MASFDKGKLQKVADNEAKVTLILDDGTTYQQAGKLLFSDITVDPSTGMITLRAEFPNPDHILLPGMFARVQLEQAIHQNAVTVPQRAVTLNGDGTGGVMVVTPDNKVEARKIKFGDSIGDKWIVTDGLAAGEVVVMEGLQKIKPGIEVKTVPFDSSDEGK
jgi:membrane fusion protein, multidrug efflux system